MADQWSSQTLKRLDALFFSHSPNSGQLAPSMFLNLLKQFETDPTPSNMQESVSKFMMMVSIWGLVRMHNTTDLESRRQYGVFVNHLQDAENALLKSIQIHQKSVKPATPALSSLPPTRVVQSLPISTTTQL
jgi:hypothetical protein